MLEQYLMAMKTSVTKIWEGRQMKNNYFEDNWDR